MVCNKQISKMTHKKRILLLVSCILISIFRVAQAQALTGEARSHWNKASIYLENATTDNEWQLAINELEQVIKFAPGFSEAYLKLGDAYSKIITADAVNKAKYYWNEYAKTTPSSSTTIQDKIDSLEALYEMTSLRNRYKVIESLIGRWRRDGRDNERQMWEDSFDLEFVIMNDHLMYMHVDSYYYDKEDNAVYSGQSAPQIASINDEKIIIDYKQRYYITGESFDVYYHLSISLNQPSPNLISVKRDGPYLNHDGILYKVN